MKAVMLAAGVGRRLGVEGDRPKCLLEFEGRTLLERHVAILRRANVSELVLAVGFQASRIESTLRSIARDLPVRTVFNPDYELGSMVTLWTLRDDLDSDVLLMDADVLYDERIMQKLCASDHANAFLLDREFEAGDEPVKLCLREGRFVEFRKRVEVAFDECGESVGFFRFSASIADKLRDAAGRYIQERALAEPYEEAIRDVLLEHPQAFGYEDVTGLPWIEIDFPEDIERARREILPQLRDPEGVE
jgi:choline kinase